MIGKRFGKLVVDKQYGSGLRGASWICICDCGSSIKMTTTQLVKYGRLSCGCTVTRLNLVEPTPKELKQRYPLTFTSWSCMWTRCTTKNKHKCYEGITVCDRWKSFELFLKDMGPRPDKNHSIDRREPTKGYYKDNCRWVTKKFNCSNIRMNLTPERNAKVAAGVKQAHAEGKILTKEVRAKIGKGGAKRVGRTLQNCTECGNKSYLPLCQRCRKLRK